MGVAAVAVGVFIWKRGPVPKHASDAPPALFLVVTQLPQLADGGGDARPIFEHPVVGAAGAILINALSTRETAHLETKLTEWHEHAEIAKNPLSEDLSEIDMTNEVRATFAELLPRLTAAETLSRGEWRTFDGVDAHVVTACPPAAVCVDVRRETTNGQVEDRARFLAWPLTRATWLHAPPGHAHEVAEKLRDLADNPKSRVALIVDDDALTAHPSAIRDDAHDLRETVAGAADPKTDEALRMLAASPAKDTLVPWLTLGDYVLVVPKLSALAFLPRVDEEVRQLVLQVATPGLTIVSK